MHTKIHLEDEIRKNIDEVINAIDEYSKSSSLPVKNLHILRSSFACEAQAELFDVVASHLLNAEGISPYAGDILLSFLRRDFTPVFPTILREELLEKILQHSHKYTNLLQEACKLAGLKGKIVVKKSHTENCYIELTESYIFDNISPSFKVENKEFAEAKIVCIDGYIESVSEVHHVLEQISKTKDVVIAFVRGLSEEVSHTLKVNYDRRTVLFIPIVVPFDLEGINLLNDISVISNNDLVSSNKGQLISSLDIDTFKRVDNIKIYHNSVSITNKMSYDRVNSHIRFLQEKLTESNDAVKELLSKRIQKLGTTQVTINIPEGKDYSDESFIIDRCIRSIKAGIDYGVVQVDGHFYPASSYSTAELMKEKLLSTLKDIGCIIE